MFQLRKTHSVAFALAALCCFAVASQAATICTTGTNCPNLAYNGVGTFATPPMSGADMLGLAGQPWHLSALVSEASTPDNLAGGGPCNGPQCSYSNTPIVGVIFSSILPGVAIPLTSGTLGKMTLTVGSTGHPDVLKLVFPQTVIGVPLTVTAVIYLPNGTITTAKNIRPFNGTVTLNGQSGTLTYASSTAMTVLDYAGGSLTTKAN